MRWLGLTICMALLPALAGCGTSSGSSAGDATSPAGAHDFRHQGTGPIHAVATVGMVADIVRNVGGPHVEVTQLMGAGVDPHLYKATRDDVQTIMRADIVFYSGLMLEGKMIDTLVKIARTRPVTAVTELIEEKSLLEPPEFAGHYDPHVWMDASAWAACIDAVTTALCQFDPPHAADYRGHADTYRKQLDELHKYGKKSIATIPQDARVLVTSHDAFNYFGRAYGLDVQGVQGISTESEAGLQRINELVDLIVERKVGAVFVETSVPRKNIEAIVGGAQSRGHRVVIGGELFSDAMGIEGTYEGTYVGMIDHNITIATRALGGEAPAKGMQGKLSAH
jgi:manganese/zinc/iron transport system substrate-binding protein